MTEATVKTICPTCGQTIKVPKQKQYGERICAICGKLIERHHKWYFDHSTIKHRHCDDPISY